MITDLSIAKRKLLASLRQPKHRREHGLFAAEGTRCVAELSRLMHCRLLTATSTWLDENCDLIESDEICRATKADMERMTSFATPSDVIAAFEIPERRFEPSLLDGKLVMALDGLQDPGNLGTIIRVCDWFGVDTVLCSPETVDVYNPKVVKATMGALCSVNIYYTDLAETLAPVADRCYGTFLSGKNIYDARLDPEGIIIMGNEGNGVSKRLRDIIDRSRYLFIPPYPEDATHVDSLNVAVAAALTLSRFRH